ncbi:unnamed protein product, partial [Acanthocheilonema viteae]
IWEDYKLKWDPREYGGIKDLHFPGGNSQIWRPDILLYNSADDNFDSTFKSNLLVYSNGEVNWIPPGILKFSCKLDITWFPFDDQVCGLKYMTLQKHLYRTLLNQLQQVSLKFGSWTHNGFALDLQIDADDSNSTHQMDISDYVLNGEWDLIATPAVRSVKRFVCCPEPYPTIIFYMHIRRRTLYYGFNLLIPSLLISLITMLGFTLPPDAGEKITLEITILLSISFFLSMVAEMTPATSEAVPLIGVFFSCCMLVVSASVVFTVVVINLHFRTPESHIMTPLVRRILLEWLPWLLMMSRPGTVYSCGKALTESETSSRTKEDEYNPFVEEILSGRNASDAQILLLHQLYLKLKQITDQMKEDEETESLRNDWKFSAMVVDRACLICFSLFTTLSTFSIILSAPHLTV